MGDDLKKKKIQYLLTICDNYSVDITAATIHGEKHQYVVFDREQQI